MVQQTNIFILGLFVEHRELVPLQSQISDFGWTNSLLFFPSSSAVLRHYRNRLIIIHYFC